MAEGRGEVLGGTGEVEGGRGEVEEGRGEVEEGRGEVERGMRAVEGGGGGGVKRMGRSKRMRPPRPSLARPLNGVALRDVRMWPSMRRGKN